LIQRKQRRRAVDTDQCTYGASVHSLHSKKGAVKAVDLMTRIGVVTLWGTASSEAERSAARVAAASTPGLRSIKDYLFPWPARMVA
jgi:hypothetical protein